MMRILAAVLWALNVVPLIQQGVAVSPEGRSAQSTRQDQIPNCQTAFVDNVFSISGSTCTEIPRKCGANSSELYVQRTSIVHLKSGEFDRFIKLTSLTIEFNAHLENISAGAFRNLYELVNLTIANNLRLQFIEPELFRGLKNLRNLKLNKNLFPTFKYVSRAARLAVLPSLASLDVSENPFGQITKEDAYHLNQSPLRELRFSYCSLVMLDPTGLNVLPSLETLYVDGNNLKTAGIIDLIVNVSMSSSRFTEVHLGYNLLTDAMAVLVAIKEARLSRVDLSYSHFFAGIDKNYPAIPSLVHLDLSETHANGLTNGFLSADKLPNVEYLYLAHNQLLGSLFSMSLPKLKVLDLTDNTYSIDYGSIFKKTKISFKNMTSLYVLKLDSNPIQVLQPNDLAGLKNLRELYLSNTSLSAVQADSFSDLGQLELLDLSDNDFSQSHSINNQTLKGLRSLKVLNLDRSGLTCIAESGVFVHTPLLERLSMRYNTLLELHHLLLSHTPLLNFLSLRYNSFQNWDQRLFDTNKRLESVDLRFNQLTTFTPAMMSDLDHVKYLQIDGNPLSCSCSDISGLIPYLSPLARAEGGAVIRALTESNLFCSSPSSARFTPFLDMVKRKKLEDECDPSREFMLVIEWVTLGVGGLLLLIVPTVYFLRWHIKYWAFLVRQALAGYIFPEKKSSEPRGQYSYDAFVSYSNADRHFVIRLVSMLETTPPYFKLCVFERDFNVGGIITDNVVQHLGQSRRTILILSDSFAKSTWCQWEMNLAQHKRLFFKDDQNGQLIVIKIGQIMENHMTPTLRYLTKTRIYLQWNSDPKKQKLFWEKLRSSLATPLDSEVVKPRQLLAGPAVQAIQEKSDNSQLIKDALCC